MSSGVERGRKARETKLPSELTPGAVLLTSLSKAGVIARVAERFRLSRRSGSFGGMEVFAFAVLYLAAGPLPSIRAFYERWKDELPRAAALVGRHDLPSSGALSRALASMTMAEAETAADDLLLQTPGLDGLLASDAVKHFDSHGRAWQIFDYDPTVRASRQRDLEEGDDRPEAKRRALGVPGYTGRKRGEVRYRCHVLHHGGAGVWLHCSLQDGKGSAIPHLDRAAMKCRQVIDRIGHPADHSLLRTDGEFGHATAVQACARNGMHHLTRLTRPHLFDRPEVREALADARWSRIVDSGVFEREAADLGELILHDTDGEVDPIATRVVLTRFRTDREVPGRGVLRDGFQIELFGTSLPADAWPAEDVAALYAGRTVLENRFAQEDREYELERRFSDSAAGQMYFVNVGLFLWNFSVCRVAEADGVPAPKRRPHPRSPEPPIVEAALEAQLAREESDAPATTPLPAADAPPANTKPAVTAALAPALEVQLERDESGAPAPTPPPASTEPAVLATLPPTTDLDGDLRHIVAAAAARRTLPGWTFEPHEAQCPTGRPVYPYAAQASRRDTNGKKLGQDRIFVRTAAGACDGCPLRPGCFASSKQNAYKQMAFALPPDTAERAVALIKARHRKRAPVAVRRASPPADSGPSIGKPVFKAATRVAPGPWKPRLPGFRPAAARAIMREALAATTMEITLGRSRRRRHARESLTGSAVEGRHARSTWTERQRRAASDPGALAETRAPRRARDLLFSIPSTETPVKR